MGDSCPTRSLSTATQGQCGGHPSSDEAVYVAGLSSRWGVQPSGRSCRAPGPLLGSWEELLDSHIILWTDNAVVFNTLRRGTGRLWRFHDSRRLCLSVMHHLRGSTREVRWISGLENSADTPSRVVLETLHWTGTQAALPPGGFGDLSHDNC